MNRERWMALGRALGLWILFGVLLALVPILSSAIGEWVRGRTIGLSDVIGGGELLLVSTGVSAAAIGELVRHRTDDLRGLRAVLTGVGLITILFAGLLFADIAASIRANEDLDAVRVAAISLVIFSISLVTATAATVVTDVSTWTS